MNDSNTPYCRAQRDSRGFDERFPELLSPAALNDLRRLDAAPFRPLFAGIVSDDALDSLVDEANAILMPNDPTSSVKLGARLTQIWFVLHRGFALAGADAKLAQRRTIQLLYRLGRQTTGLTHASIYAHCRAFGLFSECPEVVSAFRIGELQVLAGKKPITLEAAVREKLRNPKLTRNELRALLLRLEPTSQLGA